MAVIDVSKLDLRGMSAPQQAAMKAALTAIQGLNLEDGIDAEEKKKISAALAPVIATLPLAQQAQVKTALNGYVEADDEEKRKKAVKDSGQDQNPIFQMLVTLIASLLGMDPQELTNMFGGSAPAVTNTLAAVADAEVPTAAGPEAPVVRLNPDLPEVNRLRNAAEVETATAGYKEEKVAKETRKVEVAEKIAEFDKEPRKSLVADIKEKAIPAKKPAIGEDHYADLKEFHRAQARAELLRGLVVYNSGNPVSYGWSQQTEVNGTKVVIPLANYGTSHGADLNWSGQTGNDINADLVKSQDRMVQLYQNRGFDVDASTVQGKYIIDNFNGRVTPMQAVEADNKAVREYAAAKAHNALKAAVDAKQPIDLQQFEGLEKSISAQTQAIAEKQKALEASEAALKVAGEKFGKIDALLTTAADARERPGKFRTSTMGGAFSTDAATITAAVALEKTLGVEFVGESGGNKNIRGAEDKKTASYKVNPAGAYGQAELALDDEAKKNRILRQELLDMNEKLGVLEAKKELAPNIKAIAEKRQLNTELQGLEKVLEQVEKALKDLDSKAWEYTLKGNPSEDSQHSVSTERGAVYKGPVAYAEKATRFNGSLPEGVEVATEKLKGGAVRERMEEGELMYVTSKGQFLRASELEALVAFAENPKFPVPAERLLNDKSFVDVLKQWHSAKREGEEKFDMVRMAEGASEVKGVANPDVLREMRERDYREGERQFERMEEKGGVMVAIRDQIRLETLKEELPKLAANIKNADAMKNTLTELANDLAQLAGRDAEKVMEIGKKIGKLRSDAADSGLTNLAEQAAKLGKQLRASAEEGPGVNEKEAKALQEMLAKMADKDGTLDTDVAALVKKQEAINDAAKSEVASTTYKPGRSPSAPKMPEGGKTIF